MILRLAIAWIVSFVENVWLLNPRGDAPIPRWAYFTLMPAIGATLLFAVVVPFGWLLFRALSRTRWNRNWIIPALLMTIGAILISQTLDYAPKARLDFELQSLLFWSGLICPVLACFVSPIGLPIENDKPDA